MILSDRDIREALRSGHVKIDYPGTAKDSSPKPHIHASSMDLHLGSSFKVYEHSSFTVLDPKRPETFRGKMREIQLTEGEPLIVQPGEFVLGVTQEYITVPADLVLRVEGRSSLGRLGIIVHSTAGFVDPGFEGSITLEISNLNRLGVALYPGMRICQIAFLEMSSPAETTYDRKHGSKYMGQTAPQESKLSEDAEFAKDGLTASSPLHDCMFPSQQTLPR
jgi:dCTP deaminase